jgi:hypothetical protein
VNDPFGSSVSADDSGFRPCRRDVRDLLLKLVVAAVFCRTNSAGGLHVILGSPWRHGGTAEPGRPVTETEACDDSPMNVTG